MAETNRSGLLKLILVAGAIGAALWWTGILPQGDAEDAGPNADKIEPARAAATRAEAMKLTQDEDLPAIAKANKLVIKCFDVVKMETHQVTVEDTAALKSIRAALTVTQDEPAGGSIKPYTLTFYRGDEVVRIVSVHVDGKWGIQRPGTYWVLGANDGLPELLDQLLAKGE
ncbi:MAG: hypothetical protein JW889_03420 [Verrucomicrobia bacterium]|nr:hypothetical protein [Verrucomicrobiota bacterium]